MRRLIAALVAVEVLAELSKLAARRLAQRQRDLDALTTLTAWLHAAADAGLVLQPRESS